MIIVISVDKKHPYSPPTEGIGIPCAVWGTVRPKSLKKHMKLKADFQSVLRTLESLFTTFVLSHVRSHKM